MNFTRSHAAGLLSDAPACFKKPVLAVIFATALSSLSFGAGTCPAAGNKLSGTLADFLNGNANVVGCTFGDKVFSNFSYSNPGGLAASEINVSVTQGAGQVYQVTFVANSPGSFTSAFDIGFNVNVDTTVLPDAHIVQIQDQINTGTLNPPPFVPNASALTAVHTPDAGLAQTVSLNASSFAGETAQTALMSATSVHTAASYNPTGTAGQAAGQLFTYEVDIVQAVPEPMTFGLLGAGLAAIGLVRRKLA